MTPMSRPLLALLWLTAPAAAGTVEVSPGDNVEAAIAALQPGDELVVHGGTYSNTDRFGIDVVGTEGSPIVIRAADGEHPVFTRPDAAQNLWDIDRAEYVTIRGFELSGGSAGIRIVAARFLTIEDCEIHGTEDVALRANDTGASYEALHINHNHIHDTGGTGEGMYLGCNSNACQMFDSVIERNWVHATNGAAVSQGDGIEIKEGSYGNTIRDNVIHDTGYPCILTYSTVGNGAANIIERNVMWHCGDHGIQSAADAIIRNNIILGSASNGIAMQPHQAGTPSNLVVVHNTVLHAANDAISVSGITGSVVIANNALYAQSGSAIAVGGSTTGLVVAGNVGIGAGGVAAGDLAADFVAASYAGTPPIDVFPKPAGALLGAGSATYAVADDFNGTPRDGTMDAGAYRFAATGNPGWVIAEGFKTSGGGDGSGGDGGVDDPGTDPDDGGGGCGCNARSPDGSAVLWIALGAILVRRRRKEASR
jgi:MYXO-CTERM domain-containing protein